MLRWLLRDNVWRTDMKLSALKAVLEHLAGLFPNGDPEVVVTYFFELNDIENIVYDAGAKEIQIVTGV